MNSQPILLSMLLLSLLVISGCDEPAPAKPQVKTGTSKLATKIATGPKQPTTKIKMKKRSPDRKARPPATDTDDTDDSTGEFDFSFNGSSTPYQGGGAFARPGTNESRAGLSEVKIIDRVTSLLKDAIDYAPTLAVWIIDESKSSRRHVQTIGSALRQPYSGLKQEADANRFLTAVCSFGQETKFLVDKPSPDPTSLPNAIDSLQQDASGKEMVFTAIREALSKYAGYRTEQKREVIFFVVTDEAGDDQATVDELSAQVSKYGIPIYVLGVPAPLGRDAAVDGSVEVTGSSTAIQQGPESRHSEHIELGFWGGMNDFRLLDSGFGPFALEKLCRASSGRYIALRPATSGYSFNSTTTSEWPNSGVWQPEIAAMRRYAPDYISEADYQALLKSNAACMALHNAAKLRPIEITQTPIVTFVKQSEAQLSTEVARAQQFAAKNGPTVERLYETLEKGEADRGKLPSLRWKAAYDLALGRASAVHARVEGYNEMLAALRRGQNFEDASHNTWELAAADATEANTKLRKLCAKATQLLEGVVKEHPGTPWAKLAERELQTPVGWKWTER